MFLTSLGSGEVTVTLFSAKSSLIDSNEGGIWSVESICKKGKTNYLEIVDSHLKIAPKQ